MALRAPLLQDDGMHMAITAMPPATDSEVSGAPDDNKAPPFVANADVDKGIQEALKGWIPNPILWFLFNFFAFLLPFWWTAMQWFSSNLEPYHTVYFDGCTYNGKALTIYDCIVCNGNSTRVDVPLQAFANDDSVFDSVTMFVIAFTLFFAEFLYFSLAALRERSLKLLSYGIYTSNVRGRYTKVVLFWMGLVLVMVGYLLVAQSMSTFEAFNLGDKYGCFAGKYLNRAVRGVLSASNPTAQSEDQMQGSGWRALKALIIAFFPFAPTVKAVALMISSPYSDITFVTLLKTPNRLQTFASVIRWKVDVADLNKYIVNDIMSRNGNKWTNSDWWKRSVKYVTDWNHIPEVLQKLQRDGHLHSIDIRRPTGIRGFC